MKIWTITFPGNILFWLCDGYVASDTVFIAMIFFAKFLSPNLFVLSLAFFWREALSEIPDVGVSATSAWYPEG